MIKQILHEVTQLLMQQQLSIATAESCTGGLLAHYLTCNAGSSSWFDCGWVTYSNQAKHTQLDVPLELIQQKGAVSLEVAKAMAQGALFASRADMAIAITGIAGPSGGSQDKPVGMVCFGWATRIEEVRASCIVLPAFSRERIQSVACYEALKIIRSELQRTVHEQIN